MTSDQRDLTRLPVEVFRHYLGRGFDSLAISALRSTITSNTKGHTFSLHNTMQNFEGPIVGLLPDDFWKLTWKPSNKPSQAQLQAVDAIFAFPCGYQSASHRANGWGPTRPGHTVDESALLARDLR